MRRKYQIPHEVKQEGNQTRTKETKCYYVGVQYSVVKYVWNYMQKQNKQLKTKNRRFKLTIKISNNLRTTRNLNNQKFIFNCHQKPTRGSRRSDLKIKEEYT